MATNPALMEPTDVLAPDAKPEPPFRVFSTCPSSITNAEDYLDQVICVARWSEQAGCLGMLIYTDNSLVDPWLIAQIIIQNTRTQSPLVAIQPVYMHPFSVAKMVATLASLYGRRVFLNMVAGGFKNDLTALNDRTPHDRRYERLVEYTLIVRGLLETAAPLTFEGEFYQVNGLSLHPRISPKLFPEIFVSGSSEAGRAAARAMGAMAVQYPEPPGQGATDMSEGKPSGVRLGIIARADEEEAWRVALGRFPEDRKGQLTHQFALKVSDSEWHKRLSEVGSHLNGRRNTYWLHPFETYKTFCPYLVGSYETVAAELKGYLAAGHRTYILDIPAAEEEFEHTSMVFRLASQMVAS